MPRWCGESGGAGAAGLDKGADAEAEVGDRKPRGDGLGVDGEGAFGRTIEGGGKLEKGARGAEKGEESHQQGGVHPMFAEVFLLTEESQDEKNGAEIGGDEGGFMNSPGQEKGPEAHGDIKEREDDGDFGHTEH